MFTMEISVLNHIKVLYAVVPITLDLTKGEWNGPTMYQILGQRPRIGSAFTASSQDTRQLCVLFAKQSSLDFVMCQERRTVILTL